ncbi:MAG TPA: type IV toxin-antitoxin system AbiEi family antitoxin domain-containing protein, partial [Candidatus Nanopelagicales bacterium]|nr:type IV toxin-antitoxin system AbiEi family antitoxin domain-containing protein [Candidatus Nanopelagicales bacterium]
RTAAELSTVFGSGPFTPADAIAAGISRGRLRAAVSRGLVARPHRGVLQVAAAACPDDSPYSREQHLALIRVALRLVGPTAVASHDSAAVLHGIARPSGRPLEVAQLIVPGEADFRGPGLRVRGSGLPPADRSVIAGIPTTGLGRTAVDLARGRSMPGALVALDSAMRVRICTTTGATGNELRAAVHGRRLVEAARAELGRALDGVYAWPGTVVVRQALELADPASESAAESRSRGWILRAGLPPPRVGAAVPVPGRTYWADLLWTRHRLIGEVDGFGKYGTTESVVRDRLAAEKERQYNLESAGYRVVRWTTAEPETVVIARIRCALASRH